MKTGKGAGLIAILGGILAAVGAFLPWAKISLAGIAQVPGSSMSKTVNGFVHGASDGYFVTGAGVVAVVIGLLLLVRKAKKGLAVLVILAGLLAGGLGIYNLGQAKKIASGDLRNQIKAEAMAQAGPLSPSQVAQLSAVVDQLLAGLKVSVGVGLYVVILAGVVTLVGGVLALRAEPAAAFAAAPPMGTGMPTAPPMGTGMPTAPPTGTGIPTAPPTGTVMPPAPGSDPPQA